MTLVNKEGEFYKEGSVCGKFFSAFLDGDFYFRVMDDDQTIAYDLIIADVDKNEELFELLINHGKAGFKSQLNQ